MTASHITTDRRHRRHEQTRREILDAAWTAAEEHGIAGLSLRQVARSVGMQAPSLYTYFESKDSLFDAMFAEGYHQLGAAVTQWLPMIEDLDPEATLTTILQQWIRFCQASVARYQLMFTRAVPGWVPSAEAYAVSQKEFERMAAALAPLGIAGGEHLDLFTALSSGLAAQQLANDPDGDRWSNLAPTVARMMLDQVRGRTQ